VITLRAESIEKELVSGRAKATQYEMLADWAEQSKIADRLLPLPREFNTHRLAAYRDDEKGDK